MRIGKPKALFVGERPLRGSHLADHVSERGCDCTFAVSYDEACSFLKAERFDFVFSPMRLHCVTLFPLMDLLEGSEATLFYLYGAEDGFWCLPGLRQGQRCFGSSGLSAGEFVLQLDELIEVVEKDRPPAPKAATGYSNTMASHSSVSPAEFLPPSSVRDAVVPEKQKARA